MQEMRVFSSQRVSRFKVRRQETTADLSEVIPLELAQCNRIYLPIVVALRLG